MVTCSPHPSRKLLLDQSDSDKNHHGGAMDFRWHQVMTHVKSTCDTFSDAKIDVWI